MTVPAFPGAYGWGAESTGGRGGMVIPVTNLNPSGTGSLREALEASGPRLIVFRVAGTIVDDFTLNAINPYFTIAGQTAPGNGITYRGRIKIATHNWIVRYLKFRGRSDGPSNGIIIRSEDVEGCHDGILDHLSFSWWRDDMLSINNNVSELNGDIYNISVQNCLFGASPRDVKKALLIALNRGIGCEKVHHLSIWGSGFISAGDRNPGEVRGRHLEWVNNLMYNWVSRCGSFTLATQDPTQAPEMDFINNFFKHGNGGYQRLVFFPGADPDNPALSLHLSGNTVVDTDDQQACGPILSTEDQWAGGTGGCGFVLISQVDIPGPAHRRADRLSQPPYPIPTISAVQVPQYVLGNCGTGARLSSIGNLLHIRDSIDTVLLQSVEANSGPILYPIAPYDDPLDPIEPGIAYIDTDGDGMPDEWEIAHDLNPNDPSDGPTIDSSGYSNLELFLNGTAEEPMSIITDLQAHETVLREMIAVLLAQADAIAGTIIDLRAADAALDAAADVIESD